LEVAESQKAEEEAEAEEEEDGPCRD